MSVLITKHSVQKMTHPARSSVVNLALLIALGCGRQL